MVTLHGVGGESDDGNVRAAATLCFANSGGSLKAMISTCAANFLVIHWTSENSNRWRDVAFRTVRIPF